MQSAGLKRELIFHGSHSLVWLSLCAAVIALSLGLIVYLLRYERRLVSRKVGNSLLVLRVMLLALVFLTLLEPVVTWTLDRARTGRILVGIDVSESMDTVDHHAGKAEKLRWARSLGMIGNQLIDERLDRWQSAFAAGLEPQWVGDEESVEPERRDSLSGARQEYLGEIFAGLSEISRKQLALRLLTATTDPLLGQLAAVGDVEVRLFAARSEVVAVGALDESISDPPQSIAPGLSDLTEMLAAGSGDSHSSGIMAIVMLSDGRHNAQGDPLQEATRLKDLMTPVYPVLIGSEQRPTDLAISTLDYPQTAFMQDKPLLNVTLSTSGFEGESVVVQLEAKARDADPLSEPEIQVQEIIPEGLTAQVEFELGAEQPGRYEYTVRAEVQAGETREDNNQKSFAMNVVDDKARVLILDGEARWEFRFIHNAMDRDPRVQAEKVVFRQPFIGMLSRTFFATQLDLAPDEDALQNSPFAEQDLVIVGDVAPHHMPDQAWNLLEQFVSDSGGTLVMVAGKRHFPLAYRSPVIERLLPVSGLHPFDLTDESMRVPPIDRGLRIQLTHEGEREPFLQFDADLVANRRIYSQLPGHTWGLLGKAKPGATVFASAVQPGDESPPDTQQSAAAIVHRHYGDGQVVWIAFDSTWRWRHRVGDEYHHRFWGQMARWAADNKSAAGNENVTFGPDRIDIEFGEDAIIRARWAQRFLRRFPELQAEAEIYRVDQQEAGSSKPFTTVRLVPLAARPLVHEGRAVSLPVGIYQVKLVATAAEFADDDVTAPLYVHEKQTLELSDLSSNRELLLRIAEESGGQFFLPDKVGEIAKLLRGQLEKSSIHREVDLWDHPMLLALFFTLLTLEWSVRKLNGLP